MTRGDVLDQQGIPLDTSAAYCPGTIVYYYRHLRDEPVMPVDEAILFQDDLLVIADKPHFLPVISTGRFVRESLLARLKCKLGIESLAPMHRIDRDTAGVVAFSIQPTTRDRYAALFRNRCVTKIYEAIAPTSSSQFFPLVRRSRLVEGASYMQMCEVDGPPNSESHIDILQTRDGWARYKLSPITDKKHQLRAHMAALGIPLRNDRIYPTLRPLEADNYDQPLQLLAKSLTFTDPINHCRREFVSRRTLLF